VRNSISVDLSTTRRYSPLLYEYYRKQLELAKSIQSTYNIQCNSVFDAMTLMRKCLKDYCQTVHNPEYLAIESINTSKYLADTNLNSNQFSFKDYLIKNNDCKQSNTLPVHASNIKCQSTPKKHILNLKEAFLNSTNILKNKTTETLNNTFLTSLSSTAEQSSSSSSFIYAHVISFKNISKILFPNNTKIPVNIFQSPLWVWSRFSKKNSNTKKPLCFC
jgi:hypothetical protein